MNYKHFLEIIDKYNTSFSTQVDEFFILQICFIGLNYPGYVTVNEVSYQFPNYFSFDEGKYEFPEDFDFESWLVESINDYLDKIKKIKVSEV